MRIFLFVLLVCVLWPIGAYAYVGPGLGLGAVGTFLGAVLAILLGILGFIWYPIKRLIRKLKGDDDSPPEGDR